MHVVGTAGHVDHGKSSLVTRITGIDPDRLKEEKERHLTIDLGFAWATLPGGHEVGFVDVPGHQDFIENMLAGVGGIDLALLVVAADEGIMPQTREHLAILDLLEVERGVVVLTKVDLVTDHDWLALVEHDVEQMLVGTSLARAPIARVSAHTGEGIDGLLQLIERGLAMKKPLNMAGHGRLPIDRVFAMRGFGTVVTGTLLDGPLAVGDNLIVYPVGLPARIRGLQTHQRAIETAAPGSRVAVNLTGVPVDSLQRGDVLAQAGFGAGSAMLDAHVRVLAGAPAPLRHDQEVKFFVGASQRLAHLRILGEQDELAPGEEGWIQLLLESPVYVRRDDHFILRRPSPSATIAGGRILDPAPKWRHRKRDRGVALRLKRLLADDPAERVLQALHDRGAASLQQLLAPTGLAPGEALQAWTGLVDKGTIRLLTREGDAGHEMGVSLQTWSEWRNEVEAALVAYHRANPLRAGMQLEELRRQLDLGPDLFGLLVEGLEDASVVLEAGRVRLLDFEVKLSEQQQAQVKALVGVMREAGAKPPDAEEVKRRVAEPLFHYLVDQGTLVELPDGIVLLKTSYRSWVRQIETAMRERGPLTVAQIRDTLGTTRKYVLPLLARLDAEGVTVRQGDVRRLGEGERDR